MHELRKSHEAWVAFSGWREHYRVDEVVVGGTVVQRKENGCALVTHPRFGPMPLDDERSILEDGTTYSREDWDEGEGVTVRRWRRTLVRKAAPPRERGHSQPSPGDLAITRATCEWLQERQGTASIEVLLREHPNPDRDLPGALYRQAVLRAVGRPDIAGATAEFAHRKRLASQAITHGAFRERCADRNVIAAPLGAPDSAWMRLTGPSEALTVLTRDSVVIRACRVADRLTEDDGLTAPTRDDLCIGESVWDGAIDALGQPSDCSRPEAVNWQTSVNAAINAYPYLAAGYDGDSDLGLAFGWNIYDGVKRLTLGVFDAVDGLNPSAPAFRARDTGTLRVKLYAQGIWWWHHDDLKSRTFSISGSHGTTCASIAMGNIRGGQDPDVPDETDREARSGLASRAAGFWCGMDSADTTSSIVQCLSAVKADDGVLHLDANWWVQGLDVVSASVSAGNDRCTTDEQARGLDAASTAVTDAYFDRYLPVVKSVGNKHLVVTHCTQELGAPAGSPVALAVGAMSNEDNNAYDAQRRQHLQAASSSGVTPDGRIYPHLTVPHLACGAAAGDGHSFSYIVQGATSGATPRVAGAMLLFKDWYLANHGPESGNSPGRLICNMLNFADGVAWEHHDGSGARVSAPAQGHGLGRMRMRLYEPGGMGASYVSAQIWQT